MQKNYTAIESSFDIPHLPSHHVSRLHLLDENKKLNLIVAPAGFGKTNLLYDWAINKEISHQLPLDAYNNSNVLFCHHFMHLINLSTDFICTKSTELVNDVKEIDFVDFYSLLFSELSTYTPPLNLIIDSFEHINDPCILAGLNFFIKNMPANWNITIASRTLPKLSLSQLRLENQVQTITPKQLAFSQLEASELFEKKIGSFIDNIALKKLVDNVSGWPCALMITALVSQDLKSFVTNAENIGKGNHVLLWDYFNDEVFLSLDRELQQFLFQIAPLFKINATIANCVSNSLDGQKKLMQLYQLGVFIQPLDEQNKSFALLPIFKNFLLKNPLHLTDNLIVTNHHDIAQVLVEHGDYEDALPHILESKNIKLAIQCLTKIGWHLFHDGRFNLLENIFTLIDAEVWSIPDFILLKGWVLQGQEQSAKVEPLLQEAEQYFLKNKINLSEKYEANFLALRAQVSINQSEVSRALSQAKKVLKLNNNSSLRIRIVAQNILGEAYYCTGELRLAEKHFEDVIRLASQREMDQHLIWATYQLAEIAFVQADFITSAAFIKKAHHLSVVHNATHLPLYAFTLTLRARFQQKKGNFVEASHFANDALSVMKVYGEKSTLYAKSLKAIILLDSNQLKAGREVVEDIQRLLLKYQYHIDWISSANSVQLRFWILNNDPKSVKEWLITAPRVINSLNHFNQRSNSNLIDAFIFLERYKEAKVLIEMNIEAAKKCNLKVDLNTSLIRLSLVNIKLGDLVTAQDNFLDAISLSFETQLMTNFIRSANDLKPVYQSLLNNDNIKTLEKEKINAIVTASKLQLETKLPNPFKGKNIDAILASKSVPRLVKNIPLTSREWEVLGLIHLNFKNTAISEEMQVAPTTVKSHIRNIYQKLGLEDRKNAKVLCLTLLDLI